MARDLAIDLGTSTTHVFAMGRGVILEEPTVIAMNTRSHEVLAVGDEALQLIGRTPGYIVAVRPLREGAITDFDITERTIRLLLRRAGVTKLNRPRILLCVPAAMTSVERRAVKEAARRAGASAAHLIEQPMAAAIGAGLDVHEPVGSMVVDVGAAPPRRRSSPSAASWPTGRCGAAGTTWTPPSRSTSARPTAWPSATGRPRTSRSPSARPGPPATTRPPRCGAARSRRGTRPRSCCRPGRSVTPWPSRSTSSWTPSSAACPSAPGTRAGHHLRGHPPPGRRLALRGLADRLAEATEVPVHPVDDPVRCVVRGAGLCLESFESLRPIFAAAES